MGKSSLFFITLNLMVSTSAFAINWGHLVTGTPEVLPKGQKTVGTVLFGYGITDRLTLGVSPMAFLSYDFYSVISRYQIYSGDNWSVGTYFWYFKSVPELQDESSFSQENFYIKLNTAYRVSDKLRIDMSYGFQKFYNEDSPYSLRPDPLGKESVFAIKGDDPYWYEAKLMDEDKKDWCEVWCIYLLEKYHGKKIEFNLLKQYFDIHSDKGFSKGYLWVLDNNPTIKFYEKVGGRCDGRDKEGEISGHKVKELIFVWDEIKL